jgi:hypothetical protein
MPRPLIYLQRSRSASSDSVVCQLFQSLASASIAWPTRTVRFGSAPVSGHQLSADCITSIGVRHNGRYFYALQPFDRRKPAVRRCYLCDTFSLTGKSTLTARLSRFESAAEPAGQRSRHSHDHRSVAVVDSVDQRPVERTVHASFLTESPMIAITRILVATPAACVALLVRVVPAVP